MEKSLNDPKISLNAAVSNTDKQTSFASQQRILSLNEIQQQKSSASTATVQNGVMSANHQNSVDVLKQKTDETNNANEAFSALNSIVVKLEDIKPGSVPPLNLYEKNNFKIVLHFARDSPHSNVHVVVISATSTNAVSALKNFSFQAAVPKVNYSFFISLALSAWSKYIYFLFKVNASQASASVEI